MGDGSAIGGWILTAAIITVLAGGASAVGSGNSDRGSGSGGTSTADRSAASASRAASAPCVRVTRGTTTDGSRYKVFPVSATGSPDCRLQLGSNGRPVTVLQQALLMCSNRAVRVDGTFSEDTRGALIRDQRRQLDLSPSGVYDSRTARTMHWPWYDRRTNEFTGRCGQASDRSL
jgi:hypothetical protein